MFNEKAHHNSYKRRMKELNGNKDYKQAPPPPSIIPQGYGETSLTTTADGSMPDEALYGRAAKPSQAGLDRMVGELEKAYVFPSRPFIHPANNITQRGEESQVQSSQRDQPLGRHQLHQREKQDFQQKDCSCIRSIYCGDSPKLGTWNSSIRT